MKVLLIAILAFAAVLVVGAVPGTGPAQASTPGSVVAPLLSCPNLDGSTEPDANPNMLGGVRVSDIILDVNAFFHDAGNGNAGSFPAGYDSDYVFMYDRTGNTPGVPDGLQRVNDIINVSSDFFVTCPRVDTQIAQATRWIIVDHPELKTENVSALAAAGYYRGSTDVPGQGIHYTNLVNWDGTFNPAAPEGLVYKDSGGLLSAQLYVTDGTVANGGVGWGTHDETGTPCNMSSCPGVEHDIDLEGAADGPQCSPDCSWDAGEGWHVHHFLCTVEIGTASAIAIPGSFAPGIADTDAHCKSFGGNDPSCTVPITVTPCYRWAVNVGWMGHLWNWLPNPNQIPDASGNNGRFADCVPDNEGWKSFNCPG